MPLLFQLSQFPWQLTPHSFLSPHPLDLNVLVKYQNGMPKVARKPLIKGRSGTQYIAMAT